MFTGLITDIGTIVHKEPIPAGYRFCIETRYAPESLSVGASMACAGVCHTIVACGAPPCEEKTRNRDASKRAWFKIDSARETLACTTAQFWTAGTHLNLEPSLSLGEKLEGHLVTGHVDQMGEIVKRDGNPESLTLAIRVSEEISTLIAPKGSVCLDGTSLTVNTIEGCVFSVGLIPHTLAVTTWGNKCVGDYVNLEVDLLMRYISRLYHRSVKEMEK